MTNPQKPYLFGFPSSLKGISFPGKPRILTVELHSGPCPPGNFSYNGEGFGLAASAPIGVTGPAPIGLIPGTSALPTFKKPPSSAPSIVNPFSSDMINRLYVWEQPVPGYISPDQTTGAAVAFLDIDNAVAALNNPKMFQILLTTSSHGTSTPPPPPEFIYYLYLTGEGQGFPGAFVNATQDINTQSFLDQSGLLPHNIDPTSPSQVSTYGDEIGAVCDMYFNNPNNNDLYKNTWGVPFSPGPSTPDLAEQEIANLITMGLSEPGYVNFFPWAVAPAPYPGQGFCSWSFRVRSWRRANDFVVGSDGTLSDVMIVPPKGKPVNVGFVQSKTVSSPNPNAKGSTNIITVNPGAMTFTISTKFS